MENKVWEIETPYRVVVQVRHKLRKQPIHSDLWFAQLRERNACYDLLMQLTGLTRSRVDNLIYGQVTAATFWLADGTIRKDHPHE